MKPKNQRPASAIGPDIVVEHGDGTLTVVEAKGSAPRRRARIKVGGVYVTGDRATAVEAKRAVAISADMLERLGHKIARPGVQLRAARDVPLFSADPEHPGRFVRRLNGKTEHGVLENGAFKVLG